MIVPPDTDLGADDEDYEPQADISKGPAILAKPWTPDVDSLLKRWHKKKLDTQPDFQRYEVWPIQKRSRLVESVLLGLPIPLFYFAEEEDGTEVVIDGQQRLTSLFRFIDNEYSLKGLGPLRSLDGKKYQDLEERLQDEISDFSLSVITIQKNSDPDVRFTMFERLNEGATKLNDQELRNSVYRGEYNEQLKQLSSNKDFMTILKQSKPHKRMVDVELVLRFMAFYNQTYLKHPDKKTKEFLNNEMEQWRHRKAKDQKKAEKAFGEAVKSALTVYGDRVARRYVAGDAKTPGKWEPRLNRALYDVQMYGFTRYSRSLVTKNSDAIYEASLDLMSNGTFNDLISHTISESKRVAKRFTMWLDMLESVIGNQQQGSRIFPETVKKKLYDADPACTICKQQIKIIDDAHIDHIVPWSKGGTTTEDNAALTHRFCNQQKQANDSITD
ncbi:hypothetical protein BST22_13695 [Mycolicibacterium chubuense]|nr:hypothetical protein BST22_13695 [Mycolicibacterium chubuense]